MTTNFAAARQSMIDSQLKPSEVNEPRLLKAIKSTARERFVPKPLRGVAYVDEDLNLGGGRYLMEPITMARILLNAELDDTDEVLVIGCATGYMAAVAAKLVSAVVALEEDQGLAEKAEAILTSDEIMNAAVVSGPLAEGYAKEGPYDAILVDGAVTDVPQAWLDQLKEGGRLVCVVEDGGVGRLTLYTKRDTVVGRRPIGDANVALLPGFERESAFEF